jgi:hypothetical protein
MYNLWHNLQLVEWGQYLSEVIEEEEEEVEYL